MYRVNTFRIVSAGETRKGNVISAHTLGMLNKTCEKKIIIVHYLYLYNTYLSIYLYLYIYIYIYIYRYIYIDR